MASKKPRRNIERQPRDEWLAEFLFRTPATSEQVLAVSQTWHKPFYSLRRVQHRLADHIEAGWVQNHRYKTSTRIGGKFYYQLTLKGFRTWLGDEYARPPTERFFYERSDARHQHTYALAQFITHLTLVAHCCGFRIEEYRPEGTVSLSYGEETVQPDGQYYLVSPAGRRFLQRVELDRSTKRQTTQVGYDKTWAKCNRVYDGYQNLHPEQSSRTVVVTTESRLRVENILAQFAQQTSNYNRSLYLGVCLDDFLATEDALCQPLFIDHRRRFVPLIPPSAVMLPPKPDRLLASLPDQAYSAAPVWQAPPISVARPL